MSYIDCKYEDTEIQHAIKKTRKARHTAFLNFVFGVIQMLCMRTDVHILSVENRLL